MITGGRFQKLASHPEVVAACVGSVREGKAIIEACRGSDTFFESFQHIANAVVALSEPEMKIWIPGHYMLFERYENTFYIVVTIKRSPVVRSLRRMIRQAFGKPKPTPQTRKGQFSPRISISRSEESLCNFVGVR